MIFNLRQTEMWIDETLPAGIAAQVEPLCRAGDALAEQDQPEQAIEKYSEAFRLLPEPPHQWVAATWILTAIGDVAFLKGDIAMASEAFREVSLCDGWHTNPFVHLRRGQLAYLNGDMRKASDGLASAFMLGGYEIFDREDEKYAEYVLSQMTPPVPAVKHPLARYHKREEDEPFDKTTTMTAGKKPWWKVW